MKAGGRRIMDIVKISMIGVCGVMLGFILKGTRPEYASFISMAVGLLILGLAVGLQVVKNLVAPVMDSLKRTAVGKTAGAIPGIGNAVNAITQLILTSAVLVRNSFGAVILVLIAAAGLQPLIHYGALSLSYRFLAALAQPVSDKRIVGALSTMGEGCAWLLKLLLTAQILCMLAFLVLMAGG